ncbi:MAG: fibrobacter succinogenes major paralogous domain-containing protein [Bacteroidales bacterium]
MKNLLIVYTILLIIAATSCIQPHNDVIIDIDGNIYHSVKIGTQTWMVENLKVTHYRNGDTIPNISDSLKWSNLKTGAYCNYNNDTNYIRTYGRLYNRFAVDDVRSIAPKGWHVPTRKDWDALVVFLGGDTSGLQPSISNKMKETGTKHWKSPNKGADNSSGFSMLPVGYRDSGGVFGGLGTVGTFWLYKSEPIYLEVNDPYIENDWFDEKIGCSVRCIKNK